MRFVSLFVVIVCCCRCLICWRCFFGMLVRWFFCVSSGIRMMVIGLCRLICLMCCCVSILILLSWCRLVICEVV